MTPASTHGVAGLARDTALSLGHLIGQHVNVARLEIAAELQATIKRARLVAVLAAIVAIGYALAIGGLAFVIGGGASVGLPFVIVGLAHVVGAGAALAFGPLRGRGAQTHPMRNTTVAVDRTLAALQGAGAPVTALEKTHAR
jgi:hypothetical protein